jgi:hypothetical protein
MNATITKGTLVLFAATLCWLVSAPRAERAASDETVTFTDSLRAALNERAAAIFKRSCATSGCHAGAYPKARLSLEPAKMAEAVANVPSRQIDTLMLVDTKAPHRSYLLMKIRGGGAIKGEIMPIDLPPLKAADVRTIELWAASLAVSGTEDPAPPEKKKTLSGREDGARPVEPPPFYGVTLINLPTTVTPGRGEILVRVSHRFYYPVNAGRHNLLGLDGPAFVLLSLEYGIRDRVSARFGRTNLSDEAQLSAAVRLAREGMGLSLPFSATLVAGAALTTTRPAGAALFDTDNLHLSAQLALSRRITDRVSLLCVPSIAGNTRRPELSAGRDHTIALGIGARAVVLDGLAFAGEWVPVLSGYETKAAAWGLGIEALRGGHVFHVFLNNAYGLTPNQYLPGGDPADGGDARLGFNIYRTF